MKKFMVLTLSLVVVLSTCCLTAFTCSFAYDVYEKLNDLYFVEWYDSEGRIYCRGVWGCECYGYIVLNGKQVAADYLFGTMPGQANVYITVSGEDLENYDGNVYKDGTAHDEYDTIDDVDENNQLTSYGGDVELFGEYFGSITLNYNQLTVDDFDAWELSSYLRTEDKLFKLSGVCDGYAAKKLVEVYIRKPMLESSTYCAFQWLPEEKSFRIYSENDDYKWYETEYAELIAEGTYTIENHTAVLTFTTDNLFNGKYPALILVVNEDYINL